MLRCTPNVLSICKQRSVRKMVNVHRKVQASRDIRCMQFCNYRFSVLCAVVKSELVYTGSNVQHLQLCSDFVYDIVQSLG